MDLKQLTENNAEKEALLALLLEESGVQLRQVETIAQRCAADSYPLSFAQQRLWFLDQLEPDAGKYNLPLRLHLEGDLCVSVLAKSLSEIVRRHEALRTCFPVLDGQPVQLISPAQTLLLPLTDLSHLPEAESVAKHIAQEEAQQSFDLAVGPLFRARLLRLRAAEHVLLLNMHHIVSDGWSIGVLIKELSALYTAYTQGQVSPLAELEIQYADYAVWQRQWMQGEVLQEQLQYWREQLQGAPAVLELPTDHARPAVQSFRGGRHAVLLDQRVSEQLQELSRGAGVTLFMSLLAAWQVLLSRYSGQEEIVVGSPIAGRTRGETEGLIGFFINTLVLRSDLSGDPSFVDLLQRVKEVCLGGYAHQEVPFEKLVEELQPERSLSHNPLFQVMFVLQNKAAEWRAMGELRLQVQSVESATAKFDLSLAVTETEAGLRCSLHYSSDLFESVRMERMLGHFETLLEGIIAAPRQRLSQLPWLTAGEQQQLLVEWNDTARAFPEESCIHQLFEAQVQRTPEAVALSYESEQLSYAELNARANRLAHYLREQGVGAEVLVGICMERSVELVVSLLAVLKAGGAYVPLDPSYPAPRLNYMMEDAGVRVLLSERELRERVEVSAQVQVLCREDLSAALAQYSATNPAVELSAANLAYVIYTSGSTGKPKGVAIAHQSSSTLLYWAKEVFSAAELAGVLASTSICFDLSVFEIFAPLSCGGQVILARDALDLPGLATAAVSLLNTVPSVMAELLRSGGLPATVRTVNLAGEPLLNTLVQQTYEGSGVARVINLYGPTEDTTYSTYSVVARGNESAPTIGRPIANTEVYILSPAMELVPVGVSGELYLGGAGLARGYLERPELTAARFVPDPFSAKPGARAYRTGDRARYQWNGEIEYQGRLDQQVKLRGFRIELGEVEAVLSEQAGVREAVVVVREDEPGDKRLVGYVVGVVNSGELRRGLQERLPEYMVPSAIVVLDQLPLTANGKVDREALPAPDGSRPELVASYVAPRTAVEEVLAKIWSEVLRVEQVGIYDNFFELGGHSLLATQVVSRVRQVLQTELGLRSLFERPTVAGLAEQLEEKSGGGLVPGVVAVGREQALPLSFAQQRLWLIDQLESSTAAYNIYAVLKLSGELNALALERGLSEIVRRHEALRTCFPVLDGQPVQLISPAQTLRLPLTDLSHLAEAESAAKRMAQEEAQQSFDLAVGPLFRARLLRLQAEEHVLLLNMHHIVSDGWSIGVLIKELSALYTAYASGLPSPLKELEIQYADYAVWQRERLQGEVLQEQLHYWREQLQGAPAVLELPTDHARPAVQSFRGGRHAVLLDQRVSEQLQELSRGAGVTLFMSLLAAWQVLLSRYSGQEEIVVGSPIAGRTRGETEGLIGFFINTLVLRSDLRGDPSFVELLQRVKEVCLGAYAHQEVPFEKLVEELQPERSLSHNPLFQVMFMLQNTPREVLRLPGLELTPIKIDNESTKFDLTLLATQRSDGLQLALEYNTDLFEAATIERMLGHFEILLEGIVAAPQQRLSQLPLLTAAEQQQLLVEWNDTARAFPEESCIHQLFEAQVQRTPEAVALSYESEQLSYAELNARANRLAYYLREQGVGAEVLVGICMERSVELVVSLLAVLKAGGAYVPLDPSYPAPRLKYMMEDAGVRVLLSERELRERVEVSARVQVLCREDLSAALAQYSATNPAVELSAANLAYVIYTSGSTGEPKGVQIQHRSVSNFLHSLQTKLHITNTDTFLAVTSLSFDIAALELFLPLMVGAEIVLATTEMASKGTLLIDTIESSDITIMQATPATWRLLVEAGWQSSKPLKKLCGGEALQRHLATELLDLPGPLWNLYGPTETTIWSALYHVRDTYSSEAPVPLGNPIANTQIYILDKYLHTVGIGISGELYIGGEGLARGYVNLPGSTAERFVPNPFSERPGERLYCTGDLVRYLSNGCIEFLGRMDHQVKVRGFRIELGEIEYVLSSHPSVRACAVTSREDTPGDARLIAYTIAVPGTTTTSSELRSHVGRKLPAYMVPSAFVTLDELPLTPNGKLDRKALPAPDGETYNSPRGYVAPSTPVEETIAAIWAQVLRVERVGIYDNFFEIGGHSLLATQVISRMREALQVELSLREFFEHANVASLVTLVTDSECASEALTLLPIPRGRFDLDKLLGELDQLSEEEVSLLISDEGQLTEGLGVFNE